MQQLGFRNYLTVKEKWLLGDRDTAHRVICQIESLHHLISADDTAFDVVIIDEVSFLYIYAPRQSKM